jgi:hypothetical protein
MIEKEFKDNNDNRERAVFGTCCNQIRDPQLEDNVSGNEENAEEEHQRDIVCRHTEPVAEHETHHNIWNQ